MFIKSQSVPIEMQTDFRRIFNYTYKYRYVLEVAGAKQTQSVRNCWYHIYPWTRKKGAAE